MTTIIMGVRSSRTPCSAASRRSPGPTCSRWCIIFVGLVISLVTVIRAAAAIGRFGDAVYLAGAAGRLNAVTTTFRLERPLQHLERPDRRHVPVPLVFRLRPVAGAALPHREVDCAEPPEPAVQRGGEDPDAVLHPVHRRDGVCFFHLPPPAREFSYAVYGCATRYVESFDARKATASSVINGTAAREDFQASQSQFDQARKTAPGGTDTNYIFLYFVTHYLPIGLAGLVLAVVFGAALTTSSGELNSLATVSVIDIYKRYFSANATDQQYLLVSRIGTAFWGVYAILSAQYAKTLDRSSR